MKNLLTIITLSMMIISCNSNYEDFTSNKTEGAQTNGYLSRTSSDPYELNGTIPQIISTDEKPLDEVTLEEMSHAINMDVTSTGRCRTTDYFNVEYTGNYFYHVVCGTGSSATHWIVPYYAGSGWGQPWQENANDIEIWHN